LIYLYGFYAVNLALCLYNYKGNYKGWEDYCVKEPHTIYLVPKLQLGNAYYQTTISTPSKTTSNPVSK
jgi:hypothetical protein